MRPMLVACLIACAAPAGAASVEAQAPMSAEAFARYTTGKTLFYAEDGAAYGAERYLPDHRVIWTFLDGECQRGRWYPQGDQICFVYEDGPLGPQCWTFFRDDEGLRARFENDPASEALIEVRQSSESLSCKTPYFGVSASE